MHSGYSSHVMIRVTSVDPVDELVQEDSNCMNNADNENIVDMREAETVL
jgi:hypothetical protein